MRKKTAVKKLPAITVITAAFVLACAAPLAALAKLPPPSPEAKAKADEAKAKTGWTDKVGAFQLCKAQDRTVAAYAKASGKAVPPPSATPPCTDPGPYTPMAAASAPPLESSGAHSPATMATSPPSSNATSAEQDGGSKGKAKTKP